jgi:hypothetical protein
MPAVTILFGALVLLVTVAAFSSIRIAREYERALVSRHRYSTSAPPVPRVYNFGQASTQIAQTTSRAVLGKSSPNELASIGE